MARDQKNRLAIEELAYRQTIAAGSLSITVAIRMTLDILELSEEEVYKKLSELGYHWNEQTKIWHYVIRNRRK